MEMLGKKRICIAIVLPIGWSLYFLATNHYIGLLLAPLSSGGVMNLFACYQNNGKMSIYCSEEVASFIGDDETHILLSDKTHIRCFYLCDILKCGYVVFSIGDLFIFASIGLSICFAVTSFI